MSYITDLLAEKTNKKSIKNAYETNDLSIIITSDGLFWYFEKCNHLRLGETVQREMKRLFPEYTYIYDEYRRA